MERTATNIRSELIALDELKPNTGQIEGLPANPRFIRNARFDRLVESIAANPEMLSLREIIACEHQGKKIIVCGNMRYQALRKIGETQAPVKMLPEETPVKFLRALTIIDNNNYGQWNYDELANSWDLDLLASCGVQLPEIDTQDIDKALEEEADKYTTMTFKLTEEQAETAKQTISAIRKKKRREIKDIDGNKNKNGNALYLICKEWAEPEK